MGNCPICSGAADANAPGDGDFQRVECARCGRFEITGSALAMLPTRLASDVKAKARLSHAIRVSAELPTTQQVVQISSMNLDELSKRPLPSIDYQTINLLRWAAKQLDDDQLGAVELPPLEVLAGIVGTIDGDRADALVSLAHKDGLVELIPDDCIAVTPRGWDKLKSVDRPPQAPSQMPIEPPNPPALKIEKAHCNRCKGECNAHIRASHGVQGSDGEVSWSHTYDVLECCGCELIYVRRQQWNSEWETIGQDEYGNLTRDPGIETTYWPPPTKRSKPAWSAQISDDVVRALFDELYTALDADLLVLATIGARTLFDRASFLKVGDPPGGFAGKMKAMLDNGLITASEKQILEAMTDAGSASAHRGYTPTFEQLSSIVDILENYIQRAFILESAAVALRKTTPPRHPLAF